VLTGLIELGDILRLWGPDRREFFFHKDTVEKARKMLLDFFKDHDEMKFYEFRELLKSSRKYTTPLLMFFDDQGLTYRDGEVRRLR
ncbi:MAG: SelB C-terminal domain-containing protein, partial [Calditrichota bacterium]